MAGRANIPTNNSALIAIIADEVTRTHLTATGSIILAQEETDNPWGVGSNVGLDFWASYCHPRFAPLPDI
jgi:hypothetical protein